MNCSFFCYQDLGVLFVLLHLLFSNRKSMVGRCRVFPRKPQSKANECGAEASKSMNNTLHGRLFIMVSFIERHDLNVFIHHLCWLFLMLKVKKATAIIIPNTSAPQKNANKLLEILSSWFTVLIWSAGIFPPIQMKTITNYYLQLYNRSYLSRAWFSYSHLYRLK